MRRRRRGAALAAAAAVAGLLSGCGGDDTESDPSQTPEDVLAAAKTALDETAGVTIGLSTPQLPDGVDGILEANGTGTHDPAFDGSLKVSAQGLTVDVPVVAVGGKVYAQLPFTKTYAEVDPGDYGAPDPADLMAPDGGISSWLTAATQVEEGEQTRQGEQVLTSYTATLPGSAVEDVIPSADGSAAFEATFEVDDDQRLVTAEVTGPFYGGNAPVDYTVTLGDYGTEKDITAP